MIYRRELMFYLELSELFDKVRSAGIPLVYPAISGDKRIEVKNSYDITLLAKEERFIVPNDISFSPEEPFYYLTGANGGGKTTYLRAVGAMAVFLQSRRMTRICSPTPVPPGSRRQQTSYPARVSLSAKSRICVDLPTPSPPSKEIKVIISHSSSNHPPAPSTTARSITPNSQFSILNSQLSIRFPLCCQCPQKPADR